MRSFIGFQTERGLGSGACRLPAASALIVALLMLGCARDEAPKKPSGDGHGEHAHEHDDTLFWQREGVEQAGYQLKLGHHGTQVFGGHDLEPAVAVLRGEQDVSDAAVYVTILSADGSEAQGAEQPLVSEPRTAKEPAHYAQAKFKVPDGIRKLVIRYRVVLPDAGESTHDVPVTVETE